jgi:hypothetical protein
VTSRKRENDIFDPLAVGERAVRMLNIVSETSPMAAFAAINDVDWQGFGYSEAQAETLRGRAQMHAVGNLAESDWMRV